MAFDIKAWVDQNVMRADVMGDGDDRLTFHTVLWNGTPPKEILVFLLATKTWGLHVKRLLEGGWRFDFLRDHAVVQLDGTRTTLFGGDGAPFFDPAGMSSVRLWKKMDDGTQLILQVGAKWPSGPEAATAVKAFFGLFEQGPLEMVATYAATFGSA